MRATRVGRETALARIVEAVRRAVWSVDPDQAVVRVAAYAGAGVVGVRVKGAPAVGAPLATLARRWR